MTDYKRATLPHVTTIAAMIVAVVSAFAIRTSANDRMGASPMLASVELAPAPTTP